MNKVTETITHVIFASPLPLYVVTERLSLNKVTFKVCEGVYKGVAETSYLVHVDDFNKSIVNTNMVEGEESFLLLGKFERRDNSRNAFLIFTKTWKTESLGKLKAISKRTALTLDNYTLVEWYI